MEKMWNYRFPKIQKLCRPCGIIQNNIKKSKNNIKLDKFWKKELKPGLNLERKDKIND